MTAAVFLDRDGVLNEPVLDPVDGRPESPLHPDDVQLVPGAAEAVRDLRAAGWLLVAVSNQPAAAKGKTDPATLRAVHDRVVALLAEQGAELDDWRYCLHRREDGCACRKPSPQMLLDAARDHDIDLARSWMVGDTDADVQAGEAAGVRTVLVEHEGTAHKRSEAAHPGARTRNLRDAASLMLRTTV